MWEHRFGDEPTEALAGKCSYRFRNIFFTGVQYDQALFAALFNALVDLYDVRHVIG